MNQKRLNRYRVYLSAWVVIAIASLAMGFWMLAVVGLMNMNVLLQQMSARTPTR